MIISVSAAALTSNTAPRSSALHRRHIRSMCFVRLYGEQLLHRHEPQARQWCFRSSIVNLAAQCWHALTLVELIHRASPFSNDRNGCAYGRLLYLAHRRRRGRRRGWDRHEK